MTTHRLIRSDFAHVISATDHAEAVEAGSRRCTLRWRAHVLNTTLLCTLELEQGANGILAHLTATRPLRPRTGLTRRLERVALAAWTAHTLTQVAAEAESAGRPVRAYAVPGEPPMTDQRIGRPPVTATRAPEM